MNRIWKMSLMITAIILLDQFTKGMVQTKFYEGESLVLVDGFFNFTYVKNPGAAFGMGANANDWIRKTFFLALPVLACFWLVSLIWSTRNKSFFECFTYSLILSGAIGNLIDRFSMGYVVDFLDFYYGRWHFPAFNVADSAISVGAVFLAILFVTDSKKKTV